MCLSKTERMHDLVIGLCINRYDLGSSSDMQSTALKHLRLLLITTCIERLHMFTIPSIQPRLRLMRAETPFPHGAGASQETVGTVSEGSVRVVPSTG